MFRASAGATLITTTVNARMQQFTRRDPSNLKVVQQLAGLAGQCGHDPLCVGFLDCGAKPQGFQHLTVTFTVNRRTAP